MSNLNTYDSTYQSAIFAAEQLLYRYKSYIANMDADDIILSKINFNDLIYRTENMVDNLKQQKVRYKFDKMSKVEFDALISNKLLGKPTQIVTVGYEHKLSDLDTLQSLSEQYSIEISELLNFNKITNQNFEDLKEQSGIIKIPTIVDLKSKTVYNDLAVVGSHSEKNAWGTDWSNEIEYDTDTEDIKIIDNEATLIQGIQNAFGEKGDIPGYPDHVIELEVGSDLEPELYDLMVMAQLESKLLRDKRIRRVEDISINTESGAKRIAVYVTPINSENPIKAPIKEVPIK